MDKREYGRLVKRRAACSPFVVNTASAFLVGGGICLFGEALRRGALALGVEEGTAPTVVAVALIFLAALATGVGVFDTVARVAGAGTLVPVTGFANAVVSPALDTKSEGWVLGVGAKIFTVAGPVLLFGVLAGVGYGLILLLGGLL